MATELDSAHTARSRDRKEPPMSETPLELSMLRTGQRLRGVVPGRIVTLLGVELLDAESCEIFYRDEGGDIGNRIIGPSEALGFELVRDAQAGARLDGDPDDFLLAAEALRIAYAARYDPMVAVNSSDVEPLPHQIRAVYQELLPRIPLRFLLADDPGAGKTVMAGLYLKELILRSDCERAIVVAPGGLVEQWREELAQKFELHFEVFGRQMLDEAQGRNVFGEHPYLIARMDQLSRDEGLMEQLGDASWDVAIVDEAHRMSARYSSWAGEIDETRRFRLGRLLSRTAHNLLLMTATPHAGKEEDFQLFMSLLDRDRFEGQFRQSEHRTDTRGLMRRMVKEDLLTFEGRPLFPERRASTVEYEPSPAERELYDEVTEYVRTEMGRAERISREGDPKRGNNVGFALTVLQRRLASSPEAILRSLQRRRERLEQRLREMRSAPFPEAHDPLGAGLPALRLDDFDDLDEETGPEERARFEREVEQVVDRATAARTIPELQAELTSLERLIASAQRVRAQDDDRKWVELRAILDEQLLSRDASGAPRKIIVFTEHRDTLEYLRQRITGLLGREDAVVTIHGGTGREDRKAARERFTHDPQALVLLATDAAGEGLNLQRAHLMVNYDLPWNPNRIEQRFGRIHRIGQREVCHLWNMVAKGTREGEVFARLLSKIDQMSSAYNGNLFNVLGEGDAFQSRSLRELLIEAIRYGDRPEVKAKLDRVIDASVTDGLREMTAERALHRKMFSGLDLEEIRKSMELARERRLQPGYIAAFFHSAFGRLGGRIRRREAGRFEITRVPKRLVDLARRRNRWAPIAELYERVAFEPSRIRPEGLAPAALLAPGHPLLDAVIEATIEDLAPVLTRGTVLVDRRETQPAEPLLMYTVEQRVRAESEGAPLVSHHFDYPLRSPAGGITASAAPPHLDFDAPDPSEREALAEVLAAPWLREDHEGEVRAWVFRNRLRPRMREIAEHRTAEAARTLVQVRERLLAEINHWYREHTRLAALEREGQSGRIRAEQAIEKARALEARLAARTAELERAGRLAAESPLIRGLALVVPGRMLARDGDGDALRARDTEAVERRAVEAVLAAERALGRRPEEQPRNNPGYDVRSFDRAGHVHYIEVKGRLEGADTFTVTSNEVAFAQTQGARHRLALVRVSTDGPGEDELRYVTDAFAHLEPAATTRSYTEEWRDYWERGGAPR